MDEEDEGSTYDRLSRIISQLIIWAREYENRSELARKTELSRPTIYKVDSPEFNPRATTLLALAKVMSEDETLFAETQSGKEPNKNDE